MAYNSLANVLWNFLIQWNLVVRINLSYKKKDDINFVYS